MSDEKTTETTAADDKKVMERQFETVHDIAVKIQNRKVWKNCTVQEIEAKLNPNYQVSEAKNHKQMETKIGKYVIGVDEKLSPLLQRINQFQDEPITTMSCQHSWFGWAVVCFDYDEFKKFIERIQKLSIEKKEFDFYNHFTSDKCKLDTTVGEYEGCEGIQFGINWRFDQSLIPSFVTNLDKLVKS